MTVHLRKAIFNVSIFGSRVRQDHDAASDLDILIAVEDGSGTSSDGAIAGDIERMFGMKPSISWYGRKKIEQMFDEGDLFAWHLFLESSPILGHRSLADTFGKPTAYRSASKDIVALGAILQEVGAELLIRPHNAIFELGVAYVCARNIAMAASAHVLKKPDFGRYSPFSVGGFPLTMDDYQLAAACRMSSQRGSSPPQGVSVDKVRSIQQALLPWSDAMLAKVPHDE